MKNYLLSLSKTINLAIVFSLLIIASCNKKFDEPPLGEDPDIPVTMTISELKAKYKAANDFQTIGEDKVIAGIVTADDRTGNFYQQIVIQDETGGIPIRIDKNSLYANYPIGRKVYVKVKGLMLGDYGGNIQLGMDTARSADGKYLNLGLIPSTMIGRYIIAGSFGNVVTPKIVKPSDFTTAINDPLLSMLVQINNAEFNARDTAKTYANADEPRAESARNFTIKPCDDSKSIVLRNSSYAAFAGLPVAKGNGALIGVASIFNKTVQLGIRDTSDVQFTGERCSGQTPPTGDIITIAKLKENYLKGDSTIAANVRIEGIVVSDTKNESALNYRIQDATDGIQIRFTNAAANPNVGVDTKLIVNVGGLKFGIFQGGLQIANVSAATVNGTGSATPKTAKIAEIIAAGKAWESTVVKIDNILSVEETSSNRAGKNYTIKDATGEMVTFIRTTSGITIPGKTNSITGYVSIYQGSTGPTIVQLIVRTQNDIVGGGGGTGGSNGNTDMNSNGDGSAEKPFSITQAKANQGQTSVWIKGYIVGDVNGASIKDNSEFNKTSWASASNILIAASENETDYTKCIPVQLPSGKLRSEVNLKDNPGNHKKAIYLKGSLEKYFNVEGIKSTSEYQFP